MAEVTLDGVVVGTLDLYSPTLQVGQVVWSAEGLSAALTHNVKVAVLGVHNPASLGARVDVDAFAMIR